MNYPAAEHRGILLNKKMKSSQLNKIRIRMRFWLRPSVDEIQRSASWKHETVC